MQKEKKNLTKKRSLGREREGRNGRRAGAQRPEVFAFWKMGRGNIEITEGTLEKKLGAGPPTYVKRS